MSVIVKVNGLEITSDTLEKNLSRFIMQLTEDENSNFVPNEDNLKYVKTEVLNFLIERMLLLQMSRKSGLEVSESAIRDNIEKMRSYYDTDEEWSEKLGQLGVDEKTLFNEIRDDMLCEKFLNQLYRDKINFTEEDMVAYFNEHEEMMRESNVYSFYEAYAASPEQVKSAYNIFASNDDVDKIKDQLQAFDITMMVHADISENRIPPEIINVLNDLTPGKIGTMTTADNHYLVYKLNNKALGRRLSYDDVKESLAEYLINSGKKEIYQNALAEEMENAQIEYEDISYLNNKKDVGE